jgi:hypothetical protein
MYHEIAGTLVLIAAVPARNASSCRQSRAACCFKKTSGKASDEQDGQQGHPWDDKRSEFFFFHNGITALRCATR